MNKWILTSFLLFSIITGAWAAPSGSIISRMETINDSIVQIRTVYKRPVRNQNRIAIASYERFGTGIIIDAEGIIVTNTHIVANAPQILVALSNGKIYEARPIYVSEADFTFLKIFPAQPVKPIIWADSAEARLGEPIVALGASDLNDQSIMGGIITSLIESHSSGQIEMLEINLNLYKGDSGGPILDQEGHLLGIVMGKRLTQDRKSYAIASNKIRQEYLNFKRKMQ